MAKQKRSENTYQKINTLYKRDINNIIMQYDEWVCPEFEYLRNCLWDATTKIDGTNIRLEVTQIPHLDDNGEPYEIGWDYQIKGKTDNASVPDHLKKFIKDNYPKEKVLEALGLKDIMTKDDWKEKGWIVSKEDPRPDYEKIPKRYTLYGEGYGAKIQKAGGRYIKNKCGLIGFDVKVNDIYLLRPNMLDIFNKLGCPTTHYHGQMTIDQAIEKVRKGFIDEIAEDRTMIAEGLVLTSPIGLRNRNGQRLIVKIKYADFQKYRNKYGTDDKVEQIPNPMYKEQ